MLWSFRKSTLTAGLVLASFGAAGCSTMGAWSDARGDGKVMQKGDVTCLDLIPEVKQTPVRACETPSAYDVIVGVARFTYDKRTTRQHLREGVARLVSGSAYPVRSLAAARVELWINAPVFAPEAAHFIAVVMSPGCNFALPLPLDQRAWTFDRSAVQLLGRDGYPSLQAKRAGQIVVEAAGGATPARFADFLARQGFLADNANASFPVAQLNVPAFSESLAARTLTGPKSASLYVANVRMVAAGDKEGAKARAFVVSLGR
jgi:hypothetical protein